jgi:hypothetical protein
MRDFSIAIQHTPDQADRREWVRAMVEQIRREHPTIPLAVVEDKTREGSWPTYLRTLKAAAAGATHHLVLNDDVALCKDFVASVRRVIRARPFNLVSLYTNSRVAFSAWHRHESWVQNSGVEGAAVIWPTALITEFIRWQRAHIACDLPWEDVRVSMWLVKTSRPAFATVPSLTQHLGVGASLLGLNGHSKVAAWSLAPDRSGLRIDWSRGLRAPVRDRMHIRPEWWQYLRE